jgi:hypothetical protein
MWRERAVRLRTWASDERSAHVLDLVALELENAMARDGEAPLTLSQAALVSGYTTDHLRRLIRTGQLPNVGRRNAPRVRRGTLPLKAGHSVLDQTAHEVQDGGRMRIARSVVDSFNRSER